MTTIKIPSANIYNVDLEDASGKLEQVDVSANKFVSGFDDVLAKEYNIVYWRIRPERPSTSIFQREYVGDDIHINEFVSKKVSIEEIARYDLAVYDFDCTFLIDKDARFKVEANKTNITEDECYVVRKKFFETFDANLNKISEREETIKSSTNIKYNKVKNAFEYSLDTTEIVGGEGSIWGTIVATYGADDSVEYLMSETITIESQYVTPESVNISQGSSVINKFSLPTNELIQEESLFVLNPGGSYLDIYHLFEERLLPRIIRRYQNGQRVIVIKCSISNYYATSSGQLLICPNDAHFPSVFQLHQFVEPYMFTSKGEVPIGVKADGTPMTFEIIGIDYIFKGVVWQELTIREYIE